MIELVQLIELLASQRQQLSNQLESIRSSVMTKEIKRQLNYLQKRIATLELDLNERIKADANAHANKERLLSIIGIGEKTANRLISYLPNVYDFKSAKQLAADIGLTPKQHQSGGYRGKTRLSKCGNAQLRKILYMPALVAKRANPHLKPFCQRLEKNGLSPKQIVCAVMRKLVHIIFGMLKHQQNFNPALV